MARRFILSGGMPVAALLAGSALSTPRLGAGSGGLDLSGRREGEEEPGAEE